MGTKTKAGGESNGERCTNEDEQPDTHGHSRTAGHSRAANQNRMRRNPVKTEKMAMVGGN